MFAQQGVPVVEFDKMIDVQFATFAEHKYASEEGGLKDIKFVRVDSGFADVLKKENPVQNGEEDEKLCAFFSEILAKGENFTVKCDYLKDETVPALLNLSEQSRRFADMMKAYGGGQGMGIPEEETLVLNRSNPLVEKIASAMESDRDACTSLARQVYMLALVAQRPLTADEMTQFIAETSRLLADSL